MNEEKPVYDIMYEHLLTLSEAAEEADEKSLESITNAILEMGSYKKLRANRITISERN